MNEEALQSAFRETLDLPGNTDFNTLAFAKTEGWDSIAHMRLIVKIEEKFGIMMQTSDVLALSSYLVAKDIISKYLEKKSE